MSREISKKLDTDTMETDVLLIKSILIKLSVKFKIYRKMTDIFLLHKY